MDKKTYCNYCRHSQKNDQQRFAIDPVTLPLEIDHGGFHSCLEKILCVF